MSEKKYKLDLKSALAALDRGDLDWYSRLTDDEKKGYTPLVLMRYMSSLNNQHPDQMLAVLAVNDIVNVGFWSLSKHNELLHKLLCLTGRSKSPFRPWMAIKRAKKSGKVNEWISEQHPELNNDEIELLKSYMDAKSFTQWVKDTGVDDKAAKELTDAWKRRRDD